MTHRTRAPRLITAATADRRRRTTVRYRDAKVTITHHAWCDVASHVDEVAVVGPDGGCSTALETVTLSSGAHASAYLWASETGPQVLTDIPADIVMSAEDVAAVAALLSNLNALGMSATPATTGLPDLAGMAR